MNTKLTEYSLAERREVVQPVIRLLEIGNLVLCYVRILENFKLCEGRLLVIRILFLKLCDLFFGWLVARCCIVLDLPRESKRGCRDGLSCAMEAEWEKNVFTSLTLVTSGEFSFGHRKTMT